MHRMSRPHFHGCTCVAMATWMTLTAGACGKGLFTLGPSASAIGDGGTEADGAGYVPPDANGAVDLPPSADGQVDLTPNGDGQALPNPDAPPGADRLSDDAIPESNSIVIIDGQSGEVDLGDAKLSVPKAAFAQPTTVMLTLVSDDGKLEGYPGPIGPIYSVSGTDAQQRPVTLQHPATFTLSFRPAGASIPEGRVALSYLDTAASLWIIVSGSSYNAGTGVITANVNVLDFKGAPLLLAPIVSCLIGGQTCALGKTCQGGACQ